VVVVEEPVRDMHLTTERSARLHGAMATLPPMRTTLTAVTCSLLVLAGCSDPGADPEAAEVSVPEVTEDDGRATVVLDWSWPTDDGIDPDEGGAGARWTYRAPLLWSSPTTPGR
jgi:hypothetical protein